MGRVTEYTSSATATVELPFRCPAGCGYQGMASHTAQETSTRKVQGWEHDAAERQAQFQHAHQSAQAGAAKLATKTLKLAACPQCGKRSGGAVSGHVLVNALGALIAATISIGAMIISVGSFGDAKISDGLGMGAISIVTGLIAFVIVALARKMYRDAKEKIVFRAT
jgi:hypothetical protein